VNAQHNFILQGDEKNGQVQDSNALELEWGKAVKAASQQKEKNILIVQKCVRIEEA